MYQGYASQSKYKRFPFFRIISILVIVIFLSVTGWETLLHSFTFISGTQILGVFTNKLQPIDQATLTNRLSPLLPQDWSIGIYVYDLKSGSDYGLNQNQVFEAASLTKIPVLLTLFSEVQQGNSSLSQKIPVQADEVQDYGTSILQYSGPGTEYSLNDLAWYMANRSDNTSYQVLTDYYGLQKINSNLAAWGYQNSNIDKDTTTPKEIAGMFRDIYNSKIVHGQLNINMETLLINTVDESRIPAGVPQGVVVFHKIGNAVGGLQDAGVVELSNRPYSIAILTHGVSDEAAATQTIERISKEIFDYMSTLP